MRILITGGAGYIGSIVTEVLLQDRHEVVVYDSLLKGHRGAIPSEAVFIQGDLLETKKLRDVMSEHHTEAVIHMAASSLVGESVTNPRTYYKNNVVAGLSLLNAMGDCNVRKIVFSSTAAVYGEPQKQPIEETDPTQPTNPYGETKLAFEQALHWYSAAYNLRYASLRYFNAAGASEKNGEVHDPETHLIPLVLQTAGGLRPHTEIFGDDYPTRDGTCIRDYIHVLDLARAHVLALGILEERNRIYNLGCGGTGYSVREVIDTARSITGTEIPVRVIDRRAGDPSILIASSERIQQELGWRPELQTLPAIIGSAWNWLQKHPKGYED
jgi:UDP-glucose 4-epimerase